MEKGSGGEGGRYRGIGGMTIGGGFPVSRAFFRSEGRDLNFLTMRSITSVDDESGTLVEFLLLRCQSM